MEKAKTTLTSKGHWNMMVAEEALGSILLQMEKDGHFQGNRLTLPHSRTDPRKFEDHDRSGQDRDRGRKRRSIVKPGKKTGPPPKKSASHPKEKPLHSKNAETWDGKILIVNGGPKRFTPAAGMDQQSIMQVPYWLIKSGKAAPQLQKALKIIWVGGERADHAESTIRLLGEKKGAATVVIPNGTSDETKERYTKCGIHLKERSVDGELEADLQTVIDGEK
ncbi:unnamed protein product [Caenorhabditis sp. 36 PRJEB53466]|nr:unnamed protein product [Caenorhabditis sp. 36 PRJEB53466]